MNIKNYVISIFIEQGNWCRGL